MKVDLIKDCPEGKAGERVDIPIVRASVLVNAKHATRVVEGKGTTEENKRNIEEAIAFADREAEKEEEPE